MVSHRCFKSLKLNKYAQIVSNIPCRHFVLCKVASKTKHSDILVLVSEILVVVILSVSEWWLFCLSGGRSIPSMSLESTVLKRTSFSPVALSLNVYL